VDKAIDYARRAGDRAVALLAYEEAAGQYEIALQALDLKDRPEERQRFDLLMALGQAYWRADVPEKATATLEEAVQLAEALGDPHLQGDAAIAYAWAVGRGPLALTGAAVPVLERAVQALGAKDSALRARLLAYLSLGLALGSPREQRLVPAQQAKEMAERVGDLDARAAALNALHVALEGPEWTEERLAVASEWLQAADRSGDRVQILFSHLNRLTDLAELGDMEEVGREINITCDLADQTREPFHSGFRPAWGSMLAAMEGRYEEAEHLLLQYVTIAQRTQHPNYLQSVTAQFYSIRRGQGRLGELEQIIVQNAEQNPQMRSWQAALAVMYLETDRQDQAREWFERLAANDFTDIPSDLLWMVTMLLSADLARGLRDQHRAALLYEILRPYATRNIVVGTAVLCDGSASYPLGLLASTMGNWEEAERHFEDALAFDEKIGAWPWLARTRYQYAWMLQERDQPGDRGKAQGLVNQALATFEELGMKKDVERALGLKLQLQGIEPTTDQSSIGAVASAVYVDKPDLRPHAAPDGTVTILFTDIEGSTAMTERLGDQRWLELLRAHNEIVREQVQAHGGSEVKTIGDGFMVAFGSARRALQCAVDIQRAFAAHNEEHPEEPIRVRIGLHTGEAIKEAEDFYGRHVILASRIADQAQGGEILVSSLLKELTESAGDVRFGEGRQMELKGLSGRHRVFEVAW